MNQKPEKSETTKPISRKKFFFFILLWIVLWPIIIGLFAIIVAMAVGGLLQSLTSNASIKGFQLRGLFALFLATLVVICFVFIWLQGRIKTQFRQASVPVLKTYTWLGILLGIFIIVIIPDPQTNGANAGIDVQQADSILIPKLTNNAEIVSTLKAVGAKDIKNIETKFVKGYKDSNRAGEYQAYVDSTGKWAYGILTVKTGQSGNALRVVVAHEYLHHIWFKAMDEKTKIRLTSDLISVYGNDPVMRDRVKPYADTGTLQPTELFSYYCTESSDIYLTKYILAQCDRYIDRSTLILQR